MDACPESGDDRLPAGSEGVGGSSLSGKSATGPPPSAPAHAEHTQRPAGTVTELDSDRGQDVTAPRREDTRRRIDSQQVSPAIRRRNDRVRWLTTMGFPIAGRAQIPGHQVPRSQAGQWKRGSGEARGDHLRAAESDIVASGAASCGEGLMGDAVLDPGWPVGERDRAPQRGDGWSSATSPAEDLAQGSNRMETDLPLHGSMSQVSTSWSTSSALPSTRRSTNALPGTISDDVR